MGRLATNGSGGSSVRIARNFRNVHPLTLTAEKDTFDTYILNYVDEGPLSSCPEDVKAIFCNAMEICGMVFFRSTDGNYGTNHALMLSVLPYPVLHATSRSVRQVWVRTVKLVNVNKLVPPRPTGEDQLLPYFSI